jgi:hypothetical protein
MKINMLEVIFILIYILMTQLLSDLFKYEIMPFIDKSSYAKLVIVNKEFNYYCSTGITNILVIIKPTLKEMIKWGKRNVFVELRLDSNSKITDNGLSKVPNLKVLNLCNNYKITDNGLSKVPNLKVLCIHYNSKITDNGLSKVPNLKVLNLGCNSQITDNGE